MNPPIPPTPPEYVQGVTVVDSEGAILQEKELDFSDSEQVNFRNEMDGASVIVRAGKRITSCTVSSGIFETPERIDDNTFKVAFTTAPFGASGVLEVTLSGWPPVEISIEFS